MAVLNHFMQYKQQSVNTMSKGELLITLFDEAIKNLNYSVTLLNAKNYDASSKCTQKSKDIFNYLCECLDNNFTISSNLYKLYIYINQEIIKAEIKRDSAPIQEILPLVIDLRDTWAKADKLTHFSK